MSSRDKTGHEFGFNDTIIGYRNRFKTNLKFAEAVHIKLNRNTIDNNRHKGGEIERHYAKIIVSSLAKKMFNKS